MFVNSIDDSMFAIET